MASTLGPRRAVLLSVAVTVALIALRDLAGRPSSVAELSLSVMLREPAGGDPDRKSAFFAALSAVARRNGARAEDYVDPCVDGGFAAEVGGGNVLVVLEGCDHAIPGRDTRHLLLLDRDGRLLDRLACEINSRLTRLALEEDAGVFRTDVHRRAGPDGARVVIRYTPEKGGVMGNFGHEIRSGGSWHSFAWTPEGAGGVGPEEWLEKGLCRIAVRGGKFALLFPPMPRD
jgi:hypothetical protein